MPFPFWSDNKIKFNIDEIGVSSEKYLINHIENYLATLDLGLVKKTDNKLIFHKGDLGNFLRRKDFIDNGMVKIIIRKDKLIVKIKSLTSGIFFFVSMFAMFVLFDNPQNPDYKTALIIFGWLFGMNYLMRFFAHKRLKREIKELILNL
jgi:hypothetical protein